MSVHTVGHDVLPWNDSIRCQRLRPLLLVVVYLVTSTDDTEQCPWFVR